MLHKILKRDYLSEENYLKAILAISLNTNKKATTNAIAEELTSAASTRYAKNARQKASKV